FELYIAASGALDLNGLRITTTSESGSARGETFQFDDCLSFAPGTYVVVGQSADTSLNGGVTVDVDLGLNESFFFNSAQTVTVELDGVIIDTASLASPEQGIAWSVASTPDAASNDAVGGWCLDASTGVFEGSGSPGYAGVCQ
ncbi:MAG: hypothetical protein AAF658_16375, partial [Myxococcota bacterium]